MLAAQIEAHTDDPLLAITIHAREVAERLVGELQDATGIDVRLPQEGIARLAFSDDEASDLRGAVARHRQLGLRADWLSPEELRARQPGIAPDILGSARSSPLRTPPLIPTACCRRSRPIAPPSA
jgi:glycine/D-amino acid oxidase-like deaminating enzyme